MKKIIDIMILGILCFIFFINCSSNNYDQPFAEKGLLDLSNWDFSKYGNYELKGEWEFYYNRLLDPADFQSEVKPTMDGYINLPGFWKNMIINNRKLPREGYATCRLKIIINKNVTNLAVKFKEHTNPLILFINGKEISRIGVVGTDKNSSQYQSYPHIKPVISKSDTLDIIMQMSNYHFRQLAGTKTIILGQQTTIMKQKFINLLINSIAYGIILIIAFYQILLYWLGEKNDKANLYFAIFCIFMVLRSLLVGNNAYIHDFIGEIKWNIKHDLISISLFIVIFSLYQYFYTLYPQYFSSRIQKVFNTIIICHLPIILFAHPSIKFYMNYSAQVSFFVLGVYTIVIIIQSFMHNKKNYLPLLGYTILVISAFNELFSYYFSYHVHYVGFVGVTIFVVILTIHNSKRFYHLQQYTNNISIKLKQKQIEIEKLKKNKIEVSPKQFSIFIKNYMISDREREVIKLILENQTNKQIAGSLYISYNTVRKHLNNIYHKINISTREELISKILYNYDSNKIN